MVSNFYNGGIRGEERRNSVGKSKRGLHHRKNHSDVCWKIKMKFGINTFTLKMIAIATMFIDHVGAVLFPQVIFLRIIGRIAFPIFAYELVEGFVHTHDVKKYMMRLGAFALISEIPFDLATAGVPLEFGHQNVFFTLFLGLVMLYLMSKAPTVIVRFIYVLAILLFSEFLRTDYNSNGLLMILCYYVFRNFKVIKLAGVAFINVFLMSFYQRYALLSLIPIALHNGEQGPKCKRFFYAFYPAHLMILYLITIIF